MTISDVEWRMDVGPFHFEIWFDLGAACGLNQRDVWVRERLPIAQTPLTSLPGRVLLAAYQGADREAREGAFAADVARVEAEYTRAIEEVNSAPPPPPSQRSGTPSSSGTQERPSELKQAWRRRKQRRRAIETKRREASQALEQALARDLAALGREQFDAQRLQASVPTGATQYGEPRFLRSFYFEEMQSHHMRKFVRKFANDPAYRAEVDEGATAWASRDALFERNLFTVALRHLSGAELESAQADLWRWIKRHADALLALPEYARLLGIDSAFTPTLNEMDPEIRLAVAAWNAIPGVRTRYSCQGVSGVVTYEGRQILAVTPHEELAYVEFAAMPAPVVAAVLDLAPDHPVIQVMETFSTTVLGQERHQARSVRRLQSAHSNGNAAFRLACAELAAQVRPCVCP